jgi:hypothetical protein
MRKKNARQANQLGHCESLESSATAVTRINKRQVGAKHADHLDVRLSGINTPLNAL